MEITKSRLQRIIKEEIEKIQQPEADDQATARPVVGGSAVVNIQDEGALLQVLKGGGVSLSCRINGVDIYAILDEDSADSMEHAGIIKRR